MSEWKTYRLGEIVQFNPTERLAKGTLAKKVPMEYLQPFTRAISSYETAEYSGGSKFRNGDTLMARITPCLENGKTAYVSILDDGEVGFGSTEYIVFRNIEGVTDSKFVYYFVTSPWFREIAIKSMVGSSGRQRVQQSVLENLEVNLPPLDEQRRIAGILGSLDDKIELNRRLNANLEAQAQALFRSWFVDFEPFRDGPFVDSQLGKIPQGWKVETLSNLATVIKKGITPSNSETYSHYSIPAYDDAHFPEKQSGETIKSGKYIVYNNSILLSKLNPRIKRLWFIKTAEENAICSTEFIPIQTKDTELISFVFYLIDSDIFYQQALSLVNGATGSHQRFHAEDIMQIPFAWNKDAAIDFAQKATCFLQKIEDNIRENQTLSALRDTLLPKLMAGEISC